MLENIGSWTIIAEESTVNCELGVVNGSPKYCFIPVDMFGRSVTSIDVLDEGSACLLPSGGVVWWW